MPQQPPLSHASSSSTEAAKRWLPFDSLMNQSTIYRRHEARLVRSYALKDDPRPPVLRVMAGLPGLRLIVPPRESYSNMKNKSTGIPRTSYLGDYSEETLFTVVDDNQGLLPNNHSSSAASNARITEQATRATLVTGVAATLGEYLFGGQSRAALPTSPFAQRGISNGANPLLRGHVSSVDASSVLGFYWAKNYHHHPHHQSAAVTNNTTKLSLLSVAASSTSLLFGTKIALQEIVRRNHNDSAPKDLLDVSFWLSSAVAGFVAGSVLLANASLCPGTSSSPFTPANMWVTTSTTTTQSTRSMLLGRHVLAATLYFATYEVISSSFLSTSATNGNDNRGRDTPHHKSTPAILAAGALAGSVQAAALQQYNHGMIMLRLLPAATRAAPVHALIWYAYESMKDGVQ